MTAEVLVGCPRHVVGPHLSYKQLKNRHLSSGKIICRRASVSCAIELWEKIILFTSPVSTCDFNGKSILRIFQKKFIQPFTPSYQHLKLANSCKYIYMYYNLINSALDRQPKTVSEFYKATCRLRRKFRIKVLLLQPFDVKKYLTIQET